MGLGILFFFGVVEWRAVPAVEIARRCNVRSFAVEGVTFSQPPMSGNAIAIDAETGGSGTPSGNAGASTRSPLNPEISAKIPVRDL